MIDINSFLETPKQKFPKNIMKFPNGFGSMTLLKGNRRRPVMLRSPATYDVSGKVKRPIIGYATDYLEGLEMLILYNKDPKFFAKSQLTYSQVFKLWTAHEERRFQQRKAQDKLKKNEKHAYSPDLVSAYNNHCKKLYNRKIVEIYAEELQTIVDKCNKGHTTKKRIKQISKKIFLHGQFLGIDLDINVVDLVNVGSEEISDMHVPFTTKEIEKLWKNLGNKKVDPRNIIDTVLVAIHTGLRPSENLNIETTNVFLDKRIMTGGSKTEAGIDRRIPINEKIVPLIEKRLSDNNKYLFTKEDGTKFNLRHYSDLYKDLMTNLKMDHLPHDCRTTTGTKLYKANVKELIIKRILGHKVTDVTEKHYIKISDEQLIKSINKAF